MRVLLTIHRTRITVPIHQTIRGLTTPFLLIAIIVAHFGGSAAHGAPTVVQAPIKAVTVYPDQARISRVADLRLEAGQQSIVISKLPVTLNPASLRASVAGTGRITILRLTHQQKQEKESPSARIADLQRQIDSLSGPNEQALKDRLEAFTKQKELLSQIAASGGEQMAEQVRAGTVNVGQWEAAYDFVGRKLTQINDSIRLVNLQITDIDNRLLHLKNELVTISNNPGQASISVQVDLRAVEDGHATLTLEYMIGGASWTPLYDARLNSQGTEVEFTAYGEVAQRTGEEWENIDLSLSTAQPSSGTSPQALAPWNVQVYADARDAIQKYETSNQVSITSQAIKAKPVQNVDQLLRQVTGVQTNQFGQVFIKGGRAGEVSYIIDGVPVNDNLGGTGANLSMTPPPPIEAMSLLSDGAVFKALNKESVKSGGESVRAPIGLWTLKAETKLLARPHSRDGVFRQVTVTNQSQAPLLPGKVAIFAESDFLGYETIAGFVAPRQTFSLGFGMDNRVTARREVMSFKRSSRGNTSYIDQTIKLTIDNHSTDERLLVLEEPLPVSRDGRIKIKTDGLEPKPDSISTGGIATWNVKIPAGEKRDILVPYRIEYPSFVQVLGLAQ